MADISATKESLHRALATMQAAVNTETAKGGLANDNVAASKKAAAQTLALLTKAEATEKAIAVKHTAIESAKAAWKATPPDALKVNTKVLKDSLATAFPEHDKISADDFEGKVATAVQPLDNEITKKTDQPKKDLLAAQLAQLTAQQTVDTAEQDLNNKIQALHDVSADVAADLKDAGDAFAAAQKLAQAGDLDSLYQGVLKYVDYYLKQTDVTANAKGKYETALNEATTALTKWKGDLAAEAHAELEVVRTQQALDNAAATARMLQQTRDQRALHEVKIKLKPAPAPAASKAPA